MTILGLWPQCSCAEHVAKTMTACRNFSNFSFTMNIVSLVINLVEADVAVQVPFEIDNSFCYLLWVDVIIWGHYGWTDTCRRQIPPKGFTELNLIIGKYGCNGSCHRQIHQKCSWISLLLFVELSLSSPTSCERTSLAQAFYQISTSFGITVLRGKSTFGANEKVNDSLNLQ